MALNSNENTTVEIRAPEKFTESFQQSVELSLFFQTTERDGLLMYVGPEANPNMVVSNGCITLQLWIYSTMFYSKQVVYRSCLFEF